MNHKSLSFIVDHKRDGLRLGLALAILVIGLASGGTAQAKPAAAAFTGCGNPGERRIT